MNDRGRQPRFSMSIGELLVVVAILSALFAILFPAVNAAREAQNQPLVFPSLEPLYAYNVWAFLFGFPAVTTSFVALVVLAIRSIIPVRFRRYFRWKKS